ncbi:MAG: MFS transporter [Candidatus Izemoplasmatales bacterium]
MTEKGKFQLFYFIRFFGDAFFYPFMSIYLMSKGLSEGQLGIVLAITPITTILANPLWNFLIKDMRTSRMVLKFMTLIEGVLIITLTQVSGFELYLLVITLIAFMCSPFIPIQDGFAATFANRQKIEYSSIRIYASIAYVIASALAGLLVGLVGYTALFIVSGSFFIATMFIVLWLKPVGEDPTKVDAPKRDIKKLLKNREFIKYLVFYVLVIGSVRIGDSFFGVYITESRGMGMVAYGILYSAFVLVEVWTMRFLMVKGLIVSEQKLMVFSTVLFALRFLCYGLNLPLSVIIIATLFRGLSWGIIIYAHIKFVMKIVSVENITTAIMILTLFFSIFTGVGNFIFGSVIEDHGYGWLFLGMMGMLVLGLGIFLAFTPKTTSDPLEIVRVDE